MKCLFALLVDDEVHNAVRRKAVEIDNLIHNGFIGAFLPPHISLKQSVKMDDLDVVERIFDKFSAGIGPMEVTLEKFVQWESIIMVHIKEQEELRKIHYMVDDALKGHVRDIRADHDGENYHFHLTVAYGGEDKETYRKALDTLCREPLNIKTTVDRICLVYYQDDDIGAGKFITYKINRLGQP